MIYETHFLLKSIRDLDVYKIDDLNNKILNFNDIIRMPKRVRDEQDWKEKHWGCNADFAIVNDMDSDYVRLETKHGWPVEILVALSKKVPDDVGHFSLEMDDPDGFSYFGDVQNGEILSFESDEPEYKELDEYNFEL